MLVNEFFQWAVILVLLVFVVGLVRQLGHFVVPRREHLLYLGPEIDKRLPIGLLDGVAVDELRKLIAGSQAKLGLVAVMNDRCPGCKGLLAQLQVIGPPADTPLVAIVDTEDESYLEYVRGLFTYAEADNGGVRARAAGVIATPFVLAIDSEFQVKHRGISGGLHELILEWTGRRELTALDTHAHHYHSEESHDHAPEAALT